jgi:heme-degrading protein
MSIEIATKSTQSRTITIEAANELIEIARATSQQIGFEVAIAVSDAAGNLKAFERTDARSWRRTLQSTRRGLPQPLDCLPTHGRRFLRTHLFRSLRIARGL